jgi:hypothetical protein
MFWGRKQHFLDKELEAWHHAVWVWMLSNLGGREDLIGRRLLLPNRDDFPPMEGTPREKIAATFSQIQHHMGLEHWPCRLVEQYAGRQQVSEFVHVQSTRPALGTFSRDENGTGVISYDPDLAKRPMNLITMFAHELSHFLMLSIPPKPPGAEEEALLEECATEMVVAYHGFGVIAANAAFDFQQTQDFGRQGWSASTNGYLSEDSWVFAIAVFLKLKAEDPATAWAWLKPHLRKKLDKACAHLEANPDFVASILGALPVKDPE